MTAVAAGCTLAMFGATAPAHAAVSFSFMNLQASGVEVSDTQVVTGSDATTTVRLAGWANSGSDSSDSGGATWNTMLQGKLVSWGGSGVGMRYRNPDGTFESGGSPNHAIDNQGPDEFVLLAFSDAVELTSVTVGWPGEDQYDTDITVLSYGGAGIPGLGSAFSQAAYASADNTLQYQDAAAGATAGLTNDAWDFVGHYADVAINGNSVAINSIGKTSSYWLIGAYSPSVVNNGTCFKDSANAYCGTGAKDYFKLKAVAGDVPPPPPGVPEPASLGLVMLGLAGMRWYRAGRASAPGARVQEV